MPSDWLVPPAVRFPLTVLDVVGWCGVTFAFAGENGAMTKKIIARTYDEAVEWLRQHGFDLLEPPGVQNRVFLKKSSCSAAIEKTDDGGVRIFAYPGVLVNGEISKLVNRGYQQFLKTTKSEVPATAEQLQALHQVTEELKEAIGAPSLYNESLGTVSENYHYDRVTGREATTPSTPPWETRRKPAEKKKPA